MNSDAPKDASAAQPSEQPQGTKLPQSQLPGGKKRKVALYCGYLGAGYQGMARQGGNVKTIEGELESAMCAAGAISDQNAGSFKKIQWSRAARTDKGVSAVGQVVGVKMMIKPDDIIDRINSHLPSQIRVYGYTRATDGFDAWQKCDRRRYVYMLPEWVFDPSVGCGRDMEWIFGASGQQQQQGTTPARKPIADAAKALSPEGNNSMMAGVKRTALVSQAGEVSKVGCQAETQDEEEISFVAKRPRLDEPSKSTVVEATAPAATTTAVPAAAGNVGATAAGPSGVKPPPVPMAADSSVGVVGRCSSGGDDAAVAETVGGSGKVTGAAKRVGGAGAANGATSSRSPVPGRVVGSGLDGSPAGCAAVAGKGGRGGGGGGNLVATAASGVINGGLVTVTPAASTGGNTATPVLSGAVKTATPAVSGAVNTVTPAVSGGVSAAAPAISGAAGVVTLGAGGKVEEPEVKSGGVSVKLEAKDDADVKMPAASLKQELKDEPMHDAELAGPVARIARAATAQQGPSQLACQWADTAPGEEEASVGCAAHTADDVAMQVDRNDEEVNGADNSAQVQNSQQARQEPQHSGGSADAQVVAHGETHGAVSLYRGEDSVTGRMHMTAGLSQQLSVDTDMNAVMSRRLIPRSGQRVRNREVVPTGTGEEGIGDNEELAEAEVEAEAKIEATAERENENGAEGEGDAEAGPEMEGDAEAEAEMEAEADARAGTSGRQDSAFFDKLRQQIKDSSYKFDDKEQARMDAVLRLYQGVHNFHNFTSRMPASAPQAKRNILTFNTGDVVELDGKRWVLLEVLGQSFVLHQIRKMVGLAVAVMRGLLSKEDMILALDPRRDMHVPMAPALGLYLDECIYHSYNNLWSQLHSPLTLEPFKPAADQLRKDVLWPHIARQDAEELVNAQWLCSLNEANFRFSTWQQHQKSLRGGGSAKAASTTNRRAAGSRR